MSEKDRIFARCAWRLIPLMMLLYFVNIIDRVNVGFAALTMNRDLGFGPAVYGFGAGAFFLGYALFQVPANAILARVGARRWISCILLAWGTISAANATIATPYEFYALRILLGIFEAGFFPGMILYLTFWFTKSYRARFVAIFMAAFPAANIIGGPISSLILGLDGALGLAGWQWLFVLEGTPAIAMAFVVLKFLPDGPNDAPWLDEYEKHVIAERLAGDDTSQQRGFWQALRDPRVYALGVVYFGYSMAFYGVGLWLPQIVQGMGISTLATGFVVALPYIAAIIAMVLWGRSSDKSGERVWHVAWAAIAMIVGLFIASTSSFDPVIFVALSLVLAAAMALQGPFWAMPSTFLGGAAAAGGIGLINTIGTGGGGFAGPYVLGLFREATGGYAAGIAALAIGPILTAVIVIALGRSMAARTLVSKPAD